ncbi:KTSC domain-containing protein [Variovorax sp. LjRoot84]|uniref:KTSC domain-containing protein n=1 Tax=Variovorax sp. LjRoot84 TaxID=3342340 RepID=UPI003ECD5214
MKKTFTEPQGYTDVEYVAIPMTPVESHQVAAVGYDAATQTLAVTFTRGAGAIYHYPNVQPQVHAAFMAAESKGKYFGEHIKQLPFLKFRAPVAA